MAVETHFYEPSKGHRLPHSPFKAIVAPRPIGWISTISPEGRVNLAPYSFFNALCETPPIIGFSSKGRKDTLRNAEATGEFVANLATRELANQMNISAAVVGPEVDEMQLAGLEAAPSTMVKAPRVAAAPAALECKLLSITELTDLEGKGTDWFLISGQVVGIHIDPAYLRDGIFDTSMARNLARCGYRGFYSSTDTLFDMVRPEEASAFAER
ncbi:flavin reductase family protein [Ramlibacter sp.]|uniref:flavin reductase family protein n=1 Tax=Ramlibacter sp. TaxID=1917967 RepID=UPI003D0FF37D